jgi:hypothetical protein
MIARQIEVPESFAPAQGVWKRARQIVERQLQILEAAGLG